MPLDVAGFSQAFYESQSVGELARQPLDPPKDCQAGDDWNTIYPQLQSRLQSLKNWRWSWWSYWA